MHLLGNEVSEPLVLVLVLFMGTVPRWSREVLVAELLLPCLSWRVVP